MRARAHPLRVAVAAGVASAARAGGRRAARAGAELPRRRRRRRRRRDDRPRVSRARGSPSSTWATITATDVGRYRDGHLPPRDGWSTVGWTSSSSPPATTSRTRAARSSPSVAPSSDRVRDNPQNRGVRGLFADCDCGLMGGVRRARRRRARGRGPGRRRWRGRRGPGGRRSARTAIARSVVPLGLVTRRRSSAGSSPDETSSSDAPRNVPLTSVRRLLGREALLDGGRGQRLDQEEHVGRTGPGDRAQRIQLRLRNLDDLADRLEQRADERRGRPASCACPR